MGFYEERIVPRITNFCCGTKDIQKLRRRVAADLDGEVLEVGFGSGHNLPVLPPGVTKVYAVDPSQLGRKLAAERLAASTAEVEFVGLDGEKLPFEDERFSAVLTTFTLCTIPDVEAALGEIHRVLRPGGRFHFLEHGLSPNPKVARWQHRWNPIQMRIAGGCHVNRPIADLVGGAGLESDKLSNYYLVGPKSLGYLYEGVAAKPA